MSLTPKNWKSFQHYKDRAPAWIKLHKGLLDDFAFSRLPVASRALAPLLWLLASEYDNGEISCSFEEIAFRLHMSEKELREAIKPLIDGRFFSVASNALAEPEQDDCLEEEEEEETEKELSSAPRPRSDDFENLKKIYPRRKGNYGWKAAERKFNSLVKTGVPPASILSAAKRLGEVLGPKVGTEFVPMPASWLNSEDFLDLAVHAFEPADDGLIEVIRQDQLDAWDEYGRQTKGTSYPRNRAGGWRFPSKWPPGYEQTMIAQTEALAGATGRRQ